MKKITLCNLHNVQLRAKRASKMKIKKLTKKDPSGYKVHGFLLSKVRKFHDFSNVLDKGPRNTSEASVANGILFILKSIVF